METGHFPDSGPMSEQSEVFADVFPIFLDRWRERVYRRVWHDVQSYTKNILEAIFGKKK